MKWIVILALLYAGGFVFTLLYLMQAGRSGLKRRLMQTAAAIGWPAYWLAFHGLKGSATMLLRVVSFVALGCMLVVLVPLVICERRHLIS